MGLELGKIKIKRFADGEIYVQLQESVRGCDVYLIQPTCPPANENLMELLIMIDACRRASAKTITAVIPYFGYARADRKASFILQCTLMNLSEINLCLKHILHITDRTMEIWQTWGDVCESPMSSSSNSTSLSHKNGQWVRS